MTENSRIVAVVKGQLSKFSGIISKGLPKPKQRLVREMIYGIQAGKDIKLSSITRSLNEPIPLIKTEDRLSRNLDDRDFTEEINNQICRLGSRNVLDDMVIAIDPGGHTEETCLQDGVPLQDPRRERTRDRRRVLAGESGGRRHRAQEGHSPLSGGILSGSRRTSKARTTSSSK